MALLDLSILNNIRAINPERSGAEMAQRFADLAGAGLNAWKTEKARKILEDYRKWSGETDADRFDMDAEVAKRMGGFNVDDDAEKRYQQAYQRYMQGAPAEVADATDDENKLIDESLAAGTISPELAAKIAERKNAQKARADYLAAWDEKTNRDLLTKQAQAEYDRRMAEAKRGAQEAYDNLYPDAESWNEYRAARERWNPYTGEGADRRAKFDDERLYEAADAIRWYRPDIAADLEQRAKAAFDKRAQRDLYQAKMFNPLSRMERAQSAFNSAAVRLREAEARLAGDRENPMFKAQYESALSTFNLAQSALNEAQNAYFGESGAEPTGTPGDAAALATGQLKLVEDMTQEIGNFGTLDELMAEAARRGLNKKGRDELRTIWTQRVGERQKEQQLQQGERRLAQADRDYRLKETQYDEGKRGTGVGGQYSDANVQTARNIAAGLRNGGDVKSYVSDLKKIGFDVEINPVTGSIFIVRGTKKYAANSRDEVINWIESTYLPAAEAARKNTGATTGGGKTTTPKTSDNGNRAGRPLSRDEQKNLL